MPTEVLVTSRTDQQIASLTRRNRRTLDGFLDDLAARGCQALAYRLSGNSPIDHICVKHLRGTLRVVVAFETPARAWVLLVGPHDDQDPVVNVYAELYQLLGLEPTRQSGRDKPPCCDPPDGQPPVLGDALTEILDRAATLRKTRERLPERHRAGPRQLATTTAAYQGAPHRLLPPRHAEMSVCC
jgi:hypothetical protein